MEFIEIINAGKDKVRTTPDLMSAYIKAYETLFGQSPDCAGCSFSNDWLRFEYAIKNNVQSQNQKIMSDTTFNLIDPLKIYSYDSVDENGDTRRKRSYGYKMTEEFANAYLTTGTEEEISARKREFRILPEEFNEKSEVELIVQDQLLDDNSNKTDLVNENPTDDLVDNSEPVNQEEVIEDKIEESIISEDINTTGTEEEIDSEEHVEAPKRGRKPNPNK